MTVASYGYRLFIFVMMNCLCGCASLSDSRYEWTQSARTNFAWAEFDSGLVLSAYSRDFAAGWKAGFRSVLTGGDGRLPVLAPRRYWDASLFTSSDDERLRDWQRGFCCGAKQARQYDGGHYARAFLQSPCGVQSVGWPATPCNQNDFASLPVDDATPVVTIRLLGIRPVADETDTQRNFTHWPTPASHDDVSPNRWTSLNRPDFSLTSGRMPAATAAQVPICERRAGDKR